MRRPRRRRTGAQPKTGVGRSPAERPCDPWRYMEGAGGRGGSPRPRPNIFPGLTPGAAYRPPFPCTPHGGGADNTAGTHPPFVPAGLLVVTAGPMPPLPQIPGYELLRRLGGGPMTAVYS